MREREKGVGVWVMAEVKAVRQSSVVVRVVEFDGGFLMVVNGGFQYIYFVVLICFENQKLKRRRKKK